MEFILESDLIFEILKNKFSNMKHSSKIKQINERHFKCYLTTIINLNKR